MRASRPHPAAAASALALLASLLSGPISPLSAQRAAPAAAVERPDPVYAAESWRGLEVVGGQMLVSFQPDASPATRTGALAQIGAQRLRSLGPDMELVSLPPGRSLDSCLGLCATQGSIRFAQPDQLLPALTDPDDPKLNLQWGLSRVQADDAYAIYTGDPDYVVAIIDSGVMTTHLDLDEHYAWGHDYYANDTSPADIHGHGTHCAGTAAAETDNGLGIAGAAYDCRFAAYRCGNASFPTSALVSAIFDAVNQGAHVLSLSWGSYSDNQAIQNALLQARDAGCVIVAAAGNDNTSAAFYPAAYPFVLGVASSAPNNNRSSFSNHGSWVSVAAPGQSIYSTSNTGGYTYMSGTSMAAPLVAGLATLLYARTGLPRSEDTALRVRAAIEDSALDVGSWVAAGRIDYPAALAALDAGPGAQLSSLAPDSLDALGGQTVTVHGSGLSSASEVRVAGVHVALQPVSDIEAQFSAPPAPALGTADVEVPDGVHLSNTLPLVYTVTDPARLIAPLQVAVGSELRWEFGASPGHYWVLLLAASPDTMYIHGLPVLRDAFVARIGTLDSTGLGQLSVVVPTSLLGLSFHSQMVAGPGVLLSSTNIVTTTVTN